jgi:D-alanyl-D-alanine carboxypeptidase/D-alanyl-D-alanine-endopeptidase (penicillin-binding protein 4)
MYALRRAAVAVVLVAASGPAAYGITQYARQHWHDGDTVAGADVPSVLADAGKAPGAPPSKAGRAATPAGVRRVLAPALADSRLGPAVRAEVLDAATGRLLFQQGASVPVAPASVAKILTAAALLAVHKPSDRLRTEVVRGRTDGTIVLVGGGDPTLSAAPAGKVPEYPGAARLADLAAQIRKRNLPITRIVVDDSLFTGPAVSPAWAKEDVPSDYASAITPVMLDGGRANPGDVVRSGTPDLAAGQALAADLDIPDADVVRGRAPAGAAVLASVRSAPLGTITEQMLLASDNVLAECLARQVALSEHQPASFTGAAHAVRAVLARLGADPGPGMLDGSGLSPHDRLSAAAIAATLRLAVTVARIAPLVAALPVAAWSGTLAQRYRDPSDRSAAGTVRAKTGTLTDVSTLAGVVHDADGRLLVFALLADAVPGDLTPYAEAALDAAVTRLAGCGCS